METHQIAKMLCHWMQQKTLPVKIHNLKEQFGLKLNNRTLLRSLMNLKTMCKTDVVFC